ncbi:MAG: Xaa-Pro peptidase family protein [Clostridiales bacterium]|nr:Xaa-Pro peptidase family protein [Clostridiales bacterium]
MERFRAEVKKRGREAFLVAMPRNVQYLSGFTGDSTWLVITGGQQTLITDGRYTEQARAECPDWAIIETKTGLMDALKEYQTKIGFRDLAFDAGYFTVANHQRMLQSLGARLPLYGETDPCYLLRQIKDDWEIAQIAKAASIADEALFLLKKRIAPDVTEKELAGELNYQLHKLGSEGLAFDTIMAAGPQSAMPHAKPTAYRLQRGDFLTIDFGAVVQGYRSDMTRTFILGAPDKSQAELYETVLEAQQIALKEIKPKINVRRIDSFARDYLNSKGYGEYFSHGLGHSMGLEIHEDPRFSQLAEDVPLAPGMVMSVEPGVYIPGKGGLRIEETVVITGDAMKTLTQFPKTLDEMTII